MAAAVALKREERGSHIMRSKSPAAEKTLSLFCFFRDSFADSRCTKYGEQRAGFEGGSGGSVLGWVK